jgi:uncharacterized protein YoxC
MDKLFPDLKKFDYLLHRNTKNMFSTSVQEYLSSKENFCDKNILDQLDKFSGEMDVIRETQFTHPGLKYQDEFTPFLYHLRQKYSQRLKNVTETHKSYTAQRAEFQVEAKNFLEKAQALILDFNEALSTLKEFSSAVTLDQPSEIQESFSNFLNEKYPKLVDVKVNKVIDTYVDFKKFCITDLFGKKCLIDRNLTQTKNDFNKKFNKLKDYDLKNATKVYPMDLIAVVKDVKNIIEEGRDIISKSDLIENFEGVTEEYITELERMNTYLQNKKPIKASDFENKNDTIGTDTPNFDGNFANLVLSTKFICYNIKKPFFLK